MGIDVKACTFAIILILCTINLNAEFTWEQLHMKNDWQNQQGLQGGEGMQMIIGMDWNEADPNIIYFVVDTIRVYKSIDRGNSWFPVGLDLQVKGGTSIVSDPRNPDVVFFSGSRSGEPRTSDYDGIYRSIDGGENWDGPLGGTINYLKMHAGQLFLFDPDSFDGTRCQTIFAGSPDGVLLSVDGGDTWNKIALEGHYIHDLEWSSDNNLLVASNSSLYTLDAASYAVKDIGADIPTPYDAEVSSEDEAIIWVAAEGGVYKSIDGGKDFIDISYGINRNVRYTRISSSNINPDRLLLRPHLLGGTLPYWSDDGGQSWNTPEQIHSDEMLVSGHYFGEPLLFDPMSDTNALSKQGGTILKTNDGGKNWHYSSNGYSGGRVLDMIFIDENSYIFCMEDFGLYSTENNGESFVEMDIQSINGGRDCSALDADEDVIVASVGKKQDHTLVRFDGIVWSEVLHKGSRTIFIRFDPRNSSIVYEDEMISHDRGLTWETLNDGYTARGIDGNTGELYGIKELSRNLFEIAASDDTGHSWRTLGQIHSNKITEIVTDPNSAGHILVNAGREGIYDYYGDTFEMRSEEEGLAATKNNQEITAVIFDPTREGFVWAGTRAYDRHSEGMFLSEDHGKSWRNVVYNMGPYQNTWDVQVSPYDGKVFSLASGVWTTDLSDLDTGCVIGDTPPCDGEVDTAELVLYFTRWKKGEVSMFDLKDVVQTWMLNWL